MAFSGRPTIDDVARHCGLSKATVSKALNASPESNLVSDVTRIRVVEVAKSLGYRPSWRAQILARQRTQTVAVVYSSQIGAVPRGVYWEIVDALENQLAKLEYSQVFVHAREADVRLETMLGDNRFDGVLSLGMIAPDVLSAIRRGRLPAVLINSPADASWCRVNVDDHQGATDAMRHLIGLGHRRIAYNGGEEVLNHPSAIARYETYRKCMTQAGLMPMENFIGTAAKFVDDLLAAKDRPTAILDFGHWSAIEILQSLWRRGVRVPQDVSIATFNDTHPVAVVIPPLTTVSLPAWDIAVQAVKLLMAHIAEPDLDPETFTLKETLIVRESTAPPATK